MTGGNNEYVNALAVDPALQRSGWGSLLLDRLENEAARRGLGRVGLDTAKPATELIAWYERRGYRVVGNVHWEGKTYDSVVMHKTLAGANPSDEQASRYRELVAEREQADPAENPITSRMLALLGELTSREMLDACCGEGFFSRILAALGARVTGIDLSARLIEMARDRQQPNAMSPTEAIDYRVGDLSRPLPELDGRFDLIASLLALNDVRDYEGFARTLYGVGKAGARAVLSFNNPYSSLVRGHIKDYFESGAIGVYGGLSSRGVTAHYYHRTLEEYPDAFVGAGFQLAKLADVSWGEQHTLLPEGTRFPYGMVLVFDKPR